MTPSTHRENRFNNIREEIANSITHGIGAALSVSALTLLLSRAIAYGDAYHVVSASVYGVSMLLLYLASTLYHSLQHPPVKRLFRRLDHVGIALLIAGTYTPFLMVSLRSRSGWLMLATIWGLALAAIIFKMVFMDRFRPIVVAIYLTMGWLVVFVMGPVARELSAEALMWLIAGGAFYSFGTLFFIWDRLPYNHAIWHLFVMGGSACHFFAIFLHVMPAV